MYKITFVCLGNICRSPMAELIFKNLLKERSLEDMFSVTSHATSSWELGNPIYPDAQKELKRHGISGSHYAQKLSKSDLDYYDYILVMDKSNLSDVRRLSTPDTHAKIARLCDFTSHPHDIADPWYTRNFALTYEEITEGCIAFLDYILSN